MNSGGRQFGLALAAMVLFIVVVKDRAQQIPMGHATAFSSDMYFEPPNEEKVKMRLSGAEALPLPGGLLDIKSLKLETFTTNGTTEMEAESPECIYRVPDGVVDSSGHLDVWSGDGKLHLAGDGFAFDLKEGATSLILSNRVHTVIEGGLIKPFKL
jgi:hypothetical protein